MKTISAVYNLKLMLFVFTVQVSTSQDKLTTKLNKTATFRIGEVAGVSGLVMQYIDSRLKTTTYYLLRDDFGDSILVNTADNQILTSEKFKVKGILYLHSDLQKFFTPDKATTLIKTGATTITNTNINEIICTTKIDKSVSQDEIKDKKWLNDNIILILIIFTGLLGIAMIFLYVSET